jgi:predicted amidohydrolase YtcJ
MIRSGNALERSQLATVAIAGGKIQSIAPANDGAAMVRRAKRRVDLQGTLLLPGFVDTHTHLAWAGQAQWQVHWQDVGDRATALNRRVVASRIKKGFGFSAETGREKCQMQNSRR